MNELVTEFHNDMDKNPLGNEQRLKQVGNYVLEYYGNSIAGERLQLFRKVKESENHFRKWKLIAETKDFRDYSNTDLKHTYEYLTEKDCVELDQ